MTTRKEIPAQDNVSDDIQLLLFARHALTAATAGMRILPRDEWDKSFSNLMTKCSSILKEYAVGDQSEG